MHDHPRVDTAKGIKDPLDKNMMSIGLIEIYWIGLRELFVECVLILVRHSALIHPISNTMMKIKQSSPLLSIVRPGKHENWDNWSICVLCCVRQMQNNQQRESQWNCANLTRKIQVFIHLFKQKFRFLYALHEAFTFYY